MKKQNVIFYGFWLLLLVFVSCKSDDESWNYSPNGSLEEYQPVEKYTDYGENPFVAVADNPFSTFAIDADGASYANMRRFPNLGQLPPVESVRVEEFINYFDFDYDNPKSGTVSVNSELFTCPWTNGHALLRIGLKGKSLDTKPLSNIVFLIDVSGSMSDPEKLPLLKNGFKLLVDQLSESDRISIVTYAGSSAVLLNGAYGDEKQKIKAAIDKLGAGGSTAGAEGIVTAYDIAEKYFIAGGNNRVVIGTDGDFNVGPVSNNDLVKLIEEMRETGVFLTVLGVGSGNLNDSMLEQLANNGNGNYEYIDNIEQLKKVFVYDIHKFFTVAKDCKIQVIFDSVYVQQYRLIGYENRMLASEDFENDSVDAGEIGAGQTITALYEIVPKPGLTFYNVATIDFRYKMPDQNNSTLINIACDNSLTTFESASENARFAAALAGWGMLLKQSKYKGNLKASDVKNWAANAKTFDPNGFRSEFVNLISKMPL